MTGQQLPVTKIVFSNEGNVEAGEIGAGAIYLVSPGARPMRCLRLPRRTCGRMSGRGGPDG